MACRQMQEGSDREQERRKPFEALTLLPGEMRTENHWMMSEWLSLSREGQEKGWEVGSSGLSPTGWKSLFSGSMQEEEEKQEGFLWIKQFKWVTSACLVLIVVAVLELTRIIMDSLGAATIQFAIDLFKELNITKDGNIFFSPASISAAIGMLLLGARGATATQLQKVRWASLAFQTESHLRGQPSSITLRICSSWPMGQETEKAYEDMEQFQVYWGSPLPSPNTAMPSAPWCLKLLRAGAGWVALSKAIHLLIKDEAWRRKTTGRCCIIPTRV